jgi:hypothetical protein
MRCSGCAGRHVGMDICKQRITTQLLIQGGYIEILPVNPAWVYVPAYDPAIVFFSPRPGFVIAGAIHFGPAVVVAPFFVSWGWMHPYLEWRTHAIFFDYVP